MSGWVIPSSGDRRNTLGAPLNYLGHLFLSGHDPLTIVGNFMADEVKGRDFSRFPAGVQNGIRLHRAIDSFADEHAVLRAGRARVRAHAGRYAGVVMDLFNDHLLASQWDRWQTEPLPVFAQRMYALLTAHEEIMPQGIRYMFGFMKERDWLTNYATIEGIGRSLHGLSMRVPKGSVMSGAEVVLAEHIDEYRREFDIFLPEIIVHTQQYR